MKKFSYILVLLVSLLFINNVYADDLNFNYDAGDGYYVGVYDNESNNIFCGLIRRFTIKKAVFNLNYDFNSNDSNALFYIGDLDSFGLTEEQEKNIFLNVYYGLMYKDNYSGNMRNGIQVRIWEIIYPEYTFKVFSEKTCTKERNLSSTYELIDNSIQDYYKVPSFSNTNYKLKVNESLTLTDTNNYLSNFNIVDNEDVKVNISGNKLTLVPLVDKDVINVTFERKSYYSNNFTYYYNDVGSSYISSSGESEKFRSRFDVSINVIKKQDFKYKVNYYFNDKLDSSYTKELVYTGYEGDILDVKDLLEEELNGYTLFDSDYVIEFNGSGDYSINVYYRNEMYHKQFYTINVFLNDVYSKKYSFTSYGEIDTELDLSEFNSLIEGYTIDTSNLHYIINENEELNEFNLYYFNDLYGTEFQEISLADSNIYLFFDYLDIRDMFPNIKWNNFNQFQQLIITLGFNIFFALFLFLMIFIIWKLLLKLFSYIW